MRRGLTLVSACLAALAASGCTVIVDDQLNRPRPDPDAGMTGAPCTETAQCLMLRDREFDCSQVCVDNRCVAGMRTPDGVACGTGTPSLCVAGGCETRGCGDGYRDRLPGTTTPEFCDDGADGDPNDGCTDACTRPCGPGLPSCDDRDPCNGTETCESDVCVATAGLSDGAACTTSSVPSGTCEAQRCVAE